MPPCRRARCVTAQPVFFILHAAFFGLHYLFASQTAHIGALYAAFLAMMMAAGEARGPRRAPAAAQCHRLPCDGRADAAPLSRVLHRMRPALSILVAASAPA